MARNFCFHYNASIYIANLHFLFPPGSFIVFNIKSYCHSSCFRCTLELYNSHFCFTNSCCSFFFGKIIWALIWLLNHAVLFINNLPFSLWDGISIPYFETLLLYTIIISMLYWLTKKNKFAFKAGIAGIVIFTGIFALKD